MFLCNSIIDKLSKLATATLVCLALGNPLSNASQAAELVMLEQAGCAWCKRWHKEIGEVYPKTDEGLRAPLRRVDINAPWPDDLKSINKERFTPTFVLISNGVEIGRLRGYTGDNFFWFLLNEMIDKLPDDMKSISDNS